MSDFQHRRPVVARKDHRCDECLTDAINRGDTYIRESGVYDGDFYSVKLCRTCDDLWRKATQEHWEHFRGGDGVEFGRLREWLSEMEGGSRL